MDKITPCYDLPVVPDQILQRIPGFQLNYGVGMVGNLEIVFPGGHLGLDLIGVRLAQLADRDSLLSQDIDCRFHTVDEVAHGASPPSVTSIPIGFWHDSCLYIPIRELTVELRSSNSYATLQVNQTFYW